MASPPGVARYAGSGRKRRMGGAPGTPAPPGSTAVGCADVAPLSASLLCTQKSRNSAEQL